MDQTRQKLSIDLQPIYDYEMANGNSVLRVDEPAGTSCPLAVVFVKPLNKKQIATALKLDRDVTWHENDDPHYEVGGTAGFTSKKSHQFVYGPFHRS